MRNKGLVVFLVGAVILAALSLFTVDQREKALLIQFGRIVRSDLAPGLHMKLPVVQQAIKFDARIQTLDSEPQLYLTSEKKNVIVDSFVKWRVADPAAFYTATGGRIQQANDRLADVVTKRLRDAFGGRTIQQVVSGQRGDIMAKLTNDAQAQGTRLGISIVDVRIKRVDLPEDVSESVYRRMSAERKRVANKLRSEGEERAREIRAQADRDREVILANADKESQKIRGDGDAKATETYAAAFNRDPEFYAMYRSLAAYRNAFDSPSDVLLLEPDTQFFKYFKGIGKTE